MKRILLVGDGGVGKTTFVNYLKTNEFTKQYNSTLRMETHTFENFTFVDTAGQEKYCTTWKDYFITNPPDAVLLMFSVDSKCSYDNLDNWYVWIPWEPQVVIVGTKCDIDNRKMKYENTTFHREKNLPYFDISLKNGYNVDKLLDYLRTKLT